MWHGLHFQSLRGPCRRESEHLGTICVQNRNLQRANRRARTLRAEQPGTMTTPLLFFAVRTIRAIHSFRARNRIGVAEAVPAKNGCPRLLVLMAMLQQRSSFSRSPGTATIAMDLASIAFSLRGNVVGNDLEEDPFSVEPPLTSDCQKRDLASARSGTLLAIVPLSLAFGEDPEFRHNGTSVSVDGTSSDLAV